MNSEVYRDIRSAQIQSNGAKLIGQRFIVQMDDDPKHTAKTTQEFLKVKIWNILQWPIQSLDLNPIEHVSWSQLQQRPGKASQKRKPSLWWCPWVPGLRQSLPAKDSQQNIKKNYILFLIIFICPITFEPLKMGGGGLCIKMDVIPKYFVLYFCSTPWIKA